MKKKTAISFWLALNIIVGTLILHTPTADAARRRGKKKYRPPAVLTTDAGEILFGPEFTFWTQDYLTFKDILVQRMETHLVDKQFNKDKFHYHDDTFTSPNGWSFRVASDPGVIEITAKPMSVRQYELFARDMQDAIFVSAANAGIFPALYGGGGHLNIGLEYFFDKPLLLRNFIVDYLNHPELSMGILSYDTNNALPLSYIDNDIIIRFIDVLDNFGKKSSLDYIDLSEMAEYLMSALRSSKDPFNIYWNGSGVLSQIYYRFKSYALNFLNMHLREGARLEMRAVRPQASMDVWVRQIRLLRNRIKYLERLNTPIAFAPKVQINSFVGTTVTKTEALTPQIDPQEALRAFYSYVKESNEKWINHRDYIWPDWINNNQLKIFEESDWFKQMEGSRQCDSLLAS